MAKVHISISFEVTDPAALTAYARKRYAACWGDTAWQPGDLSEAVYEAMIASNEGPSPDIIGLEIIDATYEVEE